jgi:hypothetical protein
MSYVMTIVLLLLLLSAAEFFVAGIILRRLESRHPDLFVKLGMTSVEQATLSEKWLAMTRFIYSGACLRVDDVPLNILCAAIVMGEVGILYAVILQGTS